jgi:hypothetical protein
LKIKPTLKLVEISTVKPEEIPLEEKLKTKIYLIN